MNTASGATFPLIECNVDDETNLSIFLFLVHLDGPNRSMGAIFALQKKIQEDKGPLPITALLSSARLQPHGVLPSGI